MTGIIDLPLGNPWILAVATALDLVFGDPPNRVHPVVAMGSLITFLRRRLACQGRIKPLLAGLGIVAIGLAFSISAGILVLLLRDHFRWIGYTVEAILLKTTFSLRGLSRAAHEVRRALAKGELSEARRLLSWHLVSRDTSGLDAARVAAATVESVAENASDGVIAPWLFYLIGGLPAALAYRFANTADAMLGYHDTEREWLGKIPARLDDVLNWIPARLTAALIIVASPWAKGSPLQGLRIWWHDAGKTLSPNAGQPMAAAAGVLGIELEKEGCYRLGSGGRLPNEVDIGRAVRLLFCVGGIALVLAIGSITVPRLLGW
jgi:adenosylcobinamide-phosphate synthase